MNKQCTRFSASRIHGQADIDIVHGTDPARATAYVRMPQLRAFHVLALGRPVEELPRIVARISGLCPWHHHVAAATAVENALGLYLPTTARHIRELSLYLAHITDRVLHFYLMTASDICTEIQSNGHILHTLGQASFPREGLEIRHRVSRMLKKITGQPWGGDTAVIGGVSLGIDPVDLDSLHEDMAFIREKCLRIMDKARTDILPPLLLNFKGLEPVPMVSMGCVSDTGTLELSPTATAKLCFVQPDGTRTYAAPSEYQDHIVEEYAQWTQCSFPRLRTAPPLRLDPQHPEGVFRVGPLARLHTCDSISTPLAQRELEYFRTEHGPLPQNVLLYHWARLIEMIHCVEKAEELLQTIDTEDIFLRDLYQPDRPPALRHGFAHVEAPRGSLFYRITVDAQDCISACEILTPTACNNAALNITLTSALRFVLATKPHLVDPLDTACACLRAYDPCPACATHILHAKGGSHESA